MYNTINIIYFNNITLLYKYFYYYGHLLLTKNY